MDLNTSNYVSGQLQSESLLQHVINACEIGLIIVNDEAQIVDWNPWVTRHSGLDLKLVAGKNIFETFPNQKFSNLERALTQALSNKVSSVLSYALNKSPFPLVNTYGQSISQHITLKPFKVGNQVFCLIQISDVSAAVNREKQLIEQIHKNKIISDKLAREKQRVQVTLDSIADAVITTDANGLILSMNPVAELLTGVFEGDVLGKSVSSVFQVMDEHSQILLECPVLTCLALGDIVSNDLDHALLGCDGQKYSITDSVAPIKNDDDEILGAVLVFRDVSHSRALSAELNWQAQHDPLTGLVNRRAFETKMKSLLEQLKKHPENNRHYLLYLDLDQFKVVNDTCGHDAGDELLRQLVVVLQQHLRKTDLLARLGGDEFGVILESCNADIVFQISNNLRQAVQDFRFGWQTKSFKVGVSIGIAAITGFEAKAAEILSAADAACYVAKQQGRNRVHFHALGESDSSVQQQEMQWIAKLQAALDSNRFVLFAQRIQDIQSPGLDAQHYEILLRMVGEDQQLIPPGAFLPAAERFNLVSSLDKWVVENLISTLMLRSKQGIKLNNLVFSINLSGASMSDDGFLSEILVQLDKLPIPAQNLCFEITETAAISNLSNTIKFLAVLREKGCKVALDDFGSGLSSFVYLKSLPIDYLKIDGQFVKDIVINPVNKAVVDTINNLGHVMGLETIAEFVENVSTIELLLQIGVNYAQGYGVHKPCPLSDIL